MEIIEIQTVEEWLDFFRSLSEETFVKTLRAIDVNTMAPVIGIETNDGKIHKYTLELAMQVKASGKYTEADERQAQIFNRLVWRRLRSRILED
jgi:hypothetical protein